MAADPSSSEILASPPAQIERAWHLLTVLIRIGRPAQPAELASRCALSPSPSPDLVEFLCQIPGSPLLLGDGHLVTVSNVALAALAGFFSVAISPFVPRFAVRASGQRRVWADLSLIYVRKRKARTSEDALVVPRAKRRLLLDSDRHAKKSRKNDPQQLSTSSWSCSAPCMVLSMDDVLANMGNPSNILNQDIPLLPSLHDSSVVPSNFENIDLVDEINEVEKVCDDTLAIIAYKEYPDLSSYKLGSPDTEIDASSPKAITAGRLLVSKPDIGPALMFKPVLHNETWRREGESEMATSLAVRNEVMSTVPFVLESNEDWNAPTAETCTLNAKATRYQNKGTSPNSHASTINFEKSALTAEPTIVWIEKRKPFEKLKIMEGLASTIRLQSSNDAVKNRRDADSPSLAQAKRDEKCTSIKQKVKKTHNHNMPAKGNRLDVIPKATKSQLEPKLLPNFESFTIEEEEGSGGYGTVYRARRKEDGKIFAIKCPHSNAHSHHINNELRMLERFGGRNFVIKYEGSFRSDDSECFVLEHVEHDRPENLKKEIDIFELQWYGYCMFRALASLHKQGIMHRDVKPGNFLFSRKLNKGYLIDFNLANDLPQKFCRSGKSEIKSNVNLDPVYLPSVKSASYAEATIGILDSVRKAAANDLKKPLLSKNMKKSNKVYVDTFPSTDSRNKYASQAADVSGVTSAKDPTSTRTPSADKLKQPILCKGRKELINFVHETMQSPDHKVVTVPVSQRKRVAAPLGKVDRGLVIPTPMPLYSGGNAVSGAGMFKNRGNGKHKREGPCVGTKGFRAPEVLLRSYHQGCKVDIWSAGVTLLYFIIGRMPFAGDPEQNIKEIAKLRGSEDLWEVAKLHDSESSFPADLLDVQSLQPMELRHWCLTNTRRPEFIDLIPRSLFDLLDKCLTVNPRRRITANEALMHEFFAPCHDSLRKQRVLRRAAGSELGNPLL